MLLCGCVVTDCWENSIICSNAPCDELNPVRSTYATAPLSGGGGTSRSALSEGWSGLELGPAKVPSTVTKEEPEGNDSWEGGGGGLGGMGGEGA